MTDTEHRNLREWLIELRPNAIWFLPTFIGSAVAVWIVSWIPDPSVKAIFIGIGLCMNAFLIAWLSWLRTQDNKATTRELTILLQRIEKLQKALASAGRQRQLEPPQREQPRQPISGLENRQPSLAERPSRGEVGDLATFPKLGMGEEDARKQWARLNAAEKAMVRFVLLKGTATAGQLVQFRDPDGFRSTDTSAGVQQKTSLLLGDLEGGLTINPQLKAYLEKIIMQDKRRGNYF